MALLIMMDTLYCDKINGDIITCITRWESKYKIIPTDYEYIKSSKQEYVYYGINKFDKEKTNDFKKINLFKPDDIKKMYVYIELPILFTRHIDAAYNNIFMAILDIHKGPYDAQLAIIIQKDITSYKNNDAQNEIYIKNAKLYYNLRKNELINFAKKSKKITIIEENKGFDVKKYIKEYENKDIYLITLRECDINKIRTVGYKNIEKHTNIYVVTEIFDEKTKEDDLVKIRSTTNTRKPGTNIYLIGICNQPLCESNEESLPRSDSEEIYYLILEHIHKKFTEFTESIKTKKYFTIKPLPDDINNDLLNGWNNFFSCNRYSKNVIKCIRQYYDNKLDELSYKNNYVNVTIPAYNMGIFPPTHMIAYNKKKERLEINKKEIFYMVPIHAEESTKTFENEVNIIVSPNKPGSEYDYIVDYNSLKQKIEAT
jgi:hypothetical protein